MAIYAHEIAHGDPVLTRIVDGDNVPWHKKRNLRVLYLLVFPACMGIEMTSGFDSQLINTLQFAPSFLQCRFALKKHSYSCLTIIDFGNGYRDPISNEYAIQPTLLGIIGASYSLGGICAVPFAPSANQWFGRRWSIITGSLTMMCGGVLQGFAQNGDCSCLFSFRSALLIYCSGDVHCCSNDFRLWYCLLYRFWIRYDWRACVSKRARHHDLIVQFILLYWSHRRISRWSTNSGIDYQLGMANSICASNIPIAFPTCFCFVSALEPLFIAPTKNNSLLPESPRYLISKDRDDEAFEILVKYHAEGDRDSLFVRAEMAQIRTTIKTELEYARQSWWDMLRTAGMRKRVYIASMIGLFTQWSGNTLLSYYLSDILNMMGWTSVSAKTRINGTFPRLASPGIV
jgi:hypothetical protein